MRRSVLQSGEGLFVVAVDADEFVGIAAEVGVVNQGQAAVGFFDIGDAGGGIDAEDLEAF